jgi:hypothetical protein
MAARCSEAEDGGTLHDQLRLAVQHRRAPDVVKQLLLRVNPPWQTPVRSDDSPCSWLSWLRRYVIQGAPLEPTPAAETSASSEQTPPPLLSLACISGNPEVVAVLLEHGADVWAVDKHVQFPRHP